MAVRKLSHLIALLVLRGEIIFTLDQLKANPLTQAYVPAFEGLREEWGVVFGEELALRDGVSAAQARIVSIDVKLNTLASSVSKGIQTLTGDDRTHPLYVAFFKKKTLSEFRRPMLGSQLAAMTGWIGPLNESDTPSLAQLGPEVAAAVALANDAVVTRTALEASTTFFRETGNRKKFFDKVNAIRTTTHGELASMPHEMLGLPAGFADQFFRHAGKDAEEEAPTLESVDEEIAALEMQIEEKKALRANLEAQAEAEAQQEAQKAAQEAEIAELQKVADEAAQKIAEAQAKLAALSQ